MSKRMNQKISTVLIDIVGEFGEEVFHDTERLYGIIYDAWPGFENEEMRLLIVAVISEYELFFKDRNSVESSVVPCKDLVDRLVHKDFNEDKAREVVCEVGKLLGIQNTLFCNKQTCIDGGDTKYTQKKQVKIDHFRVAKEAYDKCVEGRKEIFVSYCHKDSRFANELIEHLKTLQNIHNITVWHYVEMDGGIAISEEIGRRLKKSKVVIQLLSHHYLNSKYIRDVERPIIRDGINNDGLVARWLMIRECSLLGTEFDGVQSAVKNLEQICDPKRYPPAHREKVYEEIVRQCRSLFGLD